LLFLKKIICDSNFTITGVANLSFVIDSKSVVSMCHLRIVSSDVKSNVVAKQISKAENNWYRKILFNKRIAIYVQYIIQFHRYNVQWYRVPLRIQRMILFLLQRETKVFTLNLGGIFNASMESFGMVI